ncbi:MAG: BamA/TamA family outer membrane protein [Chitinophagaceae bacterium]|nr:BamA/TamA family outer membrane protein [Chitinophagaceae bacterium]
MAAVLALMMIGSSCTVVRQGPKGKPFAFRTEVKLENVKLSPAKKIQLRDALANQVDDSLQTRKVYNLFLQRKLMQPAVFDSLYLSRSKTFMSGFLNSQGYFNPQIKDTFWIDTVRPFRLFKKRETQMRTYVRFFVYPGNPLRYDSVGYDLQTPELQQLALQNTKESLVKKNEQYSISGISNELDRLLNIYRDHGYYKITREDLYAEHDTVVAALIDPGLDPFEQFELLDSLSKKVREPTINIVFKQRTPKDSSHLKPYTWGKINVYPDRQLVEEVPPPVPDTVLINSLTIFPTTARFKNSFLARNIAIRPGTLYKQADYFKTINTFTNLGAWQQVDINIRERSDSSRILDADVMLYPAKKQSLNIDLETSRNASDAFTQGNLFGIGLNLGVRNRNGFRESISSSSNVRLGVELGPNIIQTVQASFAHSIYVPRFIEPFGINTSKMTQPRTIINFNTAYTDRRLFFDARSLNASWGYDFTKKNKNWQFTLLNFEYTDVNGGDSLDNIRRRFPSLFNDGMIISNILSYTSANSRENKLGVLKARLESSGALTGLIKELELGALRRFVRLDLEYKYLISQTNSAWAFRIFGGYGYVYGKTKDGDEVNLPFFKAYSGGGPYSMRAWAVRRLGPGASDIFEGEKTDRFGDMKLEGNIEFRFDIGTIFGIKVKSALFTDMGNIWGKTILPNGERLDSTEFRLSRLYSDLAVGTGTSLRFDFDFFLIRLDWAYQVKNPVFAKENDGWFHKLQIKDGQFQLGIGYPF